jgi:hypothetical protein
VVCWSGVGRASVTAGNAGWFGDGWPVTGIDWDDGCCWGIAVGDIGSWVAAKRPGLVGKDW